MICPFRIHTQTIERHYVPDLDKNDIPKCSRCEKYTTCSFEPCHGDECPFYYVDENDIPKCARCNGPEEEEIL